MITTDHSTMIFKCGNPECKNEFHANIVQHKGGVNDYGWWIVQCDKCQTIFDTYIGRDVNDSSLAKGGKILERFDKEVQTEQEVKDAVKKMREK
jgi:hypothetical protein